MSDEYQNLLDDLGLEPDAKTKSEPSLPEWTEASETAVAAFQAIKKLEDSKRAFIKRNSRFPKKGDWSISKAEVALSIGKKSPQSLFHGTPFSGDLTSHFDLVNKRLEDAKDRKLSSYRDGLKSRTKPMLVEELRAVKDSEKKARQTVAEDAYKLALSRMGLDVRKKLGLP